MSSQPAKNNQTELPDAEAVKAYLRAYPDFFEDNRALLDTLQIPHGSGGGTVSLVERQVATLRQKNLSLDRKLRELIDVARTNDGLVQKIHDLTLALILAETPAAALGAIEEHLRTSFAADHAVMVLFNDNDGFAELPRSRFLRQIERAAQEVKPFDTFLASAKPRCGQIRDSQRMFLFANDADEVGSAALIPLGAKARMGFVAIGSNSSDHFHPAMSTDFLLRLGEVVTTVLARCRG